ncbi:hypothetical protein J6590_078611 [Homalodisca vitripennis]|nr:hypothetical protein J6590_078611 [Homalodisca vitripennis]
MALEEGQCCGILETIKTSRNPPPNPFLHAPTQFYTLDCPTQMLSVNSSYKSYSLYYLSDSIFKVEQSSAMKLQALRGCRLSPQLQGQVP